MERSVWDTIISKYVVPFRHVNAHMNPPTLIPHKDGEPLLNKKLPELLRSAADVVPDMKIDVYSHGLLLKQAFIDALASLPNTVRLLVSFHFFNADGSENDYAWTTALLKLVLRNKPKNVEFILASHLIAPMTEQRLLEWKESWRDEIDAGLVTVHANVAINPWTGRIEGPGVVKMSRCPYDSFDHMFFGVTGNIVACCMDLEEEVVFGNVLKDEPEEMFSVLRDFYADQARMEVKHKLCHTCFGMAA